VSSSLPSDPEPGFATKSILRAFAADNLESSGMALDDSHSKHRTRRVAVRVHGVD
jgi:hypothetical protein